MRHVLVWFALALPAAAFADPTEKVATSAEPPPPMLTAGLKVGGSFPQVLNRLSSTYSLAVEVGWLSPLLDHRLGIDLELAYSQPPHEQTVSDPRVPGGSYTYTTTEKALGLFIGPRYYFLPLRGTVVPWISLGVRAQFIDSSQKGSAQQTFGQNDETGTHFAFGGQAGLGYHLGPGVLGLELQLISSPIDHLVTGKVDIGDLAVRATYLFTF